MQITLSYGATGLSLSLPDPWDVHVVRKKPMPALDDPAGAVRRALARPEGSDTLRACARGKKTACILVCDVTRPVPNGLILPALIGELAAAGMEPERITVLVATGLHRPNEGAELKEVLGDDPLPDGVRVANHFARNDTDHADLGQTPGGTPILLDRRFVKADLRIAVGLVEPHFMAGYSGGRKVVAPGVAHERTISRIHCARLLAEQRAAAGIIEGNPLHEELLQILAPVEPVLAVNAVIDEQRRLCRINFGDIRESHRAAAAFCRRYAEVPVPRRYPTVIASAGGYPLDATYYQTVKAMVAAANILEPGGALFVASACSEGLGSPEYAKAQRRLVRLEPERFLDEIRSKENAAVDEWQTQMQVRAMRAGSVRLFTEGLTDQEKSLTGAVAVDSLEDAVRKWVDRTGDTRVAVIPEGPYLIPRCTKSE